MKRHSARSRDSFTRHAPGAETLAVAARAVHEVRNEGRSSDAALEAMSERTDRAAVRAITLGTLRWYLRLEPALVPLLSRPLAAMLGFLIWTWLTVQIVILGAELNAEIEPQTAVDTTTGDERPLGERGAVVADTLGPKRGNPAALAFTMRHAEALSDRLLKRRIRRDATPKD